MIGSMLDGFEVGEIFEIVEIVWCVNALVDPEIVTDDHSSEEGSVTLGNAYKVPT